MTIKRALLQKKGVIKEGRLWNKHDVYHIPSMKSFSCLLYTTDKSLVHLENIDKDIEAELFIFCSKHASKNEIHSLTCHPIGNFGLAEYGGQEKMLVPASGILIKETIRKLKEINEKRKLGFETTTECTHHGPYLEHPTMFIEIGSSEEQYKRDDAGDAIADTLLYLIADIIPYYTAFSHVQGIAIGGSHYSANFQRHLQETNLAISHVIPKHQLEHLNKEMLWDMCKKNSDGKVDIVIVDWKGVGGHKEHLRRILEKLKKEHDIDWMYASKYV
jgi:D-aminoacyl-tRNA deacylase